METVWNAGIVIIVWLQSLGTWLVGPMQFISFFGSVTFILVLIPFIYWCVDTGLAVRIGVIVLLTYGVNEALKLCFHAPRPYWYTSQVKAYSAEPSFGIPSGHSLSSTVLFGTFAARIKRTWAWALAVLFIFLVGLSRMFLGVHFPTDVLVGWVIGALFLWAFAAWWAPVSDWVRSQTLARQIGLALGLPG